VQPCKQLDDFLPGFGPVAMRLGDRCPSGSYPSASSGSGSTCGCHTCTAGKVARNHLTAVRNSPRNISPISGVACYLDDVFPEIGQGCLRFLATLPVDESLQLFRRSVADPHLWRWIEPVLFPEDGLLVKTVPHPLHVKIAQTRRSDDYFETRMVRCWSHQDAPEAWNQHRMAALLLEALW